MAKKLEIEYRPVSELTPYIHNSRTHSDEQVDQVAASINEFGFTNPILLDGDNTIIAGHGRLLAAKKIGMPQVPTIALDHMTDAQKRAYIIADNKLAENAGWDDDLLALELGELSEMDFDITLTGFSEDELNQIMGAAGVEGLTDDDDVPDVPEIPVTVEGDVWILGNHRLMCGDSTSVDAVEKLMDGQNADLLFTSPPYAQQRDYGSAKEAVQEWDVLMNGVFSAHQVKDGASILVNLGIVHAHGKVNSYWDKWLDYMTDADWPLFGWYVWDQMHGMPGANQGRLAQSHEFIFHFAKKPGQCNKWVDKKESSISTGDKGRTFRQKDGSMKKIYSPETSAQPTKIADSVIRVNRNPSEAANTNHPATFPTKLCEYIYNSFAKMGDVIYEPFAGAGTSAIACEKFGSLCYMMELDPKYCDVIINRWQNFTGKKAVNESTGESFA